LLNQAIEETLVEIQKKAKKFNCFDLFFFAEQIHSTFKIE